MPPAPQVTVIVPARNEEANIAAAVASLVAQTAPVDIIIVNDGSTDRTGEILDRLTQTHPRLRVLEADPPPVGWTGKNHAVACGVTQARSPWLLLTDADVRHEPRAVETGLELAERTGAALVSYSPDQELGSWFERAVIPFVYCRLARAYPYESVSDPADSLAAANGQWLLISREALAAVGGLAAVKGEVLEDVALARLVKASGRGLRFQRGMGLARTRMYRSFGELWQGWAKNLYLLLGQRRGAVATALMGAALDGLAWVLLLAGAWGWPTGWMAGGWLTAAGAAFLLWRHLRYLRLLNREAYPAASMLFYTVGSVLFAALLAASARRHRRGESVEWKGRAYRVATR